MNYTIGSRIRDKRKELKLTQEELAEQLCCKKSLISQYENDKVDIKGSVIVELANLLNTTTGFLLNGEVSSPLNKDGKELLKIFYDLKNDQIRKVALEQLRVLEQLYK